MSFDESKHPRDGDGKFVDKNGEYSHLPSANRIANNIPSNAQMEIMSTQKIVKVNLKTGIQKQFDNATPKERTKIAFRYIMDNLRGKYPTKDGKEVAIERVGAKEMTHTLYEPKIRVLPELGNLIQNGQFIKISKAEHGPFKEFAYYRVLVGIRNDIYAATLNVGIRENGDSTLYDINQFTRQ